MILQKFLISDQEKEKREISFDQCRLENESSDHSKRKFVVCSERIFREICRLRHRFAD